MQRRELIGANLELLNAFKISLRFIQPHFNITTHKTILNCHELVLLDVILFDSLKIYLREY